MLFTNARIFLGNEFIKGALRVKDGRFCEVIINRPAIPEEGEEVISCTGQKIIPGLFDIHTHGALGHDFSFSSADEDEEMCRFYASHGVTSVLATTMTNEEDQLKRAHASIDEVCRRQAAIALGEGTGNEDSVYSAASIRGINLEGPFLAEKKRGAHDPQYLRGISEELFGELNGASGNRIKVMTVAPELEGAIDFIKAHSAKKIDDSVCCDENHQVISIGHTACDYELAVEAFRAGANHVTHLYNAMNGLAHRAPGIPGAAADEGAYVELICDGLHVHESVIRNTFRANPERVVMISDSIAPAGLPEGKYSSGGLDVFVKNGELRLEDGTLAGSGITLFEGLYRAITRFNIPECEAILAATYTPAASLGMEDECGRIGEGMQADFLVVDWDYNLQSVYLRGQKIR